MIILGIDYGYKRTGVSACDALELMASPVETIKESFMPKTAKRIAEIAAERKAGLVVVGLPRNMDGTEGEHAEASRTLAKMLSDEYGLAVKLFDERLTTVQAYRLLDESKTYGKKRRGVVDELAATVILNDFLASGKNA